jgi:hypothetical protein
MGLREHRVGCVGVEPPLRQESKLEIGNSKMGEGSLKDGRLKGCKAWEGKGGQTGMSVSQKPCEAGLKPGVYKAEE